MTAIAAIDVGSNAMRLAIADVNGDGQPVVVETLREAVRLGGDVFHERIISEATMDRALAAFGRFRARLDDHGVELVKAVGTSALREAKNRDRFIRRVASATGIQLRVIGGDEEARLIHMAIADSLPLDGHLALLIDIGGGSVEVSVAEHNSILTSESFKLGTVRMLQILDEAQHGEARFQRLVGEYAEAARRHIRHEVGERSLDFAIGTGGNIEAFGDLRVQLLGGKDDTELSRDELDELVERLEALTYEERINDMGLRPDRADVIVPAAIVLKSILHEAGIEQLKIPNVGLKDGMLLDLASQLQGRPDRRPAQVLASARALGLKYAFDEQHARTVARFALELFDATADRHGLGAAERLLLEVAALLHDIGQFVNVNGHHKHSYYLIRYSPIVGLSEEEKEIVANVARYHRKSPPKSSHEPYADLGKAERATVRTLSALLRLANALDVEHAGKVQRMEIRFGKHDCTLCLTGDGDLLLEEWALGKRAEMFEKEFSTKLLVEH